MGQVAGSRVPTTRVTGLILLVVAAIAALAGGAWLGLTRWLYGPQRLATEAAALARVAASGLAPLLDGTGTTLVALSRADAVRYGDGATCGALLEAVWSRSTVLLDLGVALTDGRVPCTARGAAVSRDGAVDPLLRAAREARGLVALAGADPATGVSTLLVVLPLLATDGEVGAVVYGTVDPAVVTGLLREVPLPAGATLTVVDAAGQVVARYPDAASAGRPTPAGSGIRVLATRGGDTVVAPDLDGQTRTLAARHPTGALGSGLTVVAGLPAGEGVARIGEALLAVLGLGMALSLGLAALWLAARPARRRDGPGGGGSRGPGEAALVAQIADLVGQRAREVAFLGQLAGLLQVCLSVEEAAGVVQRLLQSFFPGEAGALYVASPGRPGVERAAVWGPLAPEGAPIFQPDECWALRRVRPHVVEDTVAGLACPHLRTAVPSAYLCVPLTTQGEVLGVLHLSSGVAAGGGRPRAGRPLWTESKQRLMTTVPEQLALALANLRLREKLRSESIRDALTGLFNRRYMEESLDLELARAQRAHQSVGVLLVDVDHFKHFNDTFGHAGGDALLGALGGLLRLSVREGDLACRLGGEEFLLILPGATVAELRRRAEELREAIRGLQVYHHGQPLGPVTASMGVAASPDHGASRDALLRAADAALYRAKAAGRDQVAVAG